MQAASPTAKSAADRFAALPSLALFALAYMAVVLSHLTLLHLPYFWDEGGYYIPAALDFYHRFTLIPEFTNAHPPLPNIVLGTLWHITGYNILATRLTVCVFSAAALVAVFRLTQRLLNPAAAIAVTFLTAIYPIWFAQSTLAHADIFAAAFTLWAFALYLPLAATVPSRNTSIGVAALFSLAALSKETAIVEPAILAAIHLFFVLRNQQRRLNARWLASLSFPLLPLLCWYAYHRHMTGTIFGNPVYLRYNATANFNAAHIFTSIYYRALHLFWQRNIWLPIVLALACLLLPRRNNTQVPRGFSLGSHSRQRNGALAPGVSFAHFDLLPFVCLVAGNWLAFSVLGGALLTRYLLPIYPLLLIVCVAMWQGRTKLWPWLTLVTAAAFLSAIWLNPPTSFAPEDNLTYRDMIVIHQEATAYIEQHYPDATVLTAWPAAAELFRPDLGYVSRRIKVEPIENFSIAEIQKAAQTPGAYDTALVFTTHYTSPALHRYLIEHPNSRRGLEYAQQRDLRPAEIAQMLHGTVVWQDERDGEWAAVLRFNRTYEASLTMPVR